ncbi:MAG: methyltransferase [Pseudoclavibacter sp.]|nr:methyltransferase [Pseudoclavibacter sp.]
MRGGGLALDLVDELVLDEAAAALAGAPAPPAVVLGDRCGPLALAAAARFGAPVRVFQDPLDAERGLAAAESAGLVERQEPGPGLFVGARLVLLRLPKHLAELEEFALLAARHADPGVRLLAGGRVKHMTRGMNQVLERAFGRVRASLGRRKARVLHAAEPLPRPRIAPFPRRVRLERAAGLDLDGGAGGETGGTLLLAHGGAFSAGRLDPGARVLLSVLDAELDRVGPVRDALDLGCGTGLLALALARRLPEARVVASDRSWAACASAEATAAANGLAGRIRVLRDDAAGGLPDASFDLVLLNPPFHEGHALDERLPRRLFAAAARLLRPGGRLLTVANGHLRYRASLERLVGPSEQLHRTPKFAVMRSVRARRSAEGPGLHYP